MMLRRSDCFKLPKPDSVSLKKDIGTYVVVSNSEDTLKTVSLLDALQFLREKYLARRSVARDFQSFLRYEKGTVSYNDVKLCPKFLIDLAEDLSLLDLPYTITISKDSTGMLTWTLTDGVDTDVFPGETVVDSIIIEAQSRREAERERDRSMMKAMMQEDFDECLG